MSLPDERIEEQYVKKEDADSRYSVYNGAAEHFLGQFSPPSQRMPPLEHDMPSETESSETEEPESGDVHASFENILKMIDRVKGNRFWTKEEEKVLVYLYNLFAGDFKLILHYFPHRTINALKGRFHRIQPEEKIQSLVSRSTHDIQETMKGVTNTILRTFHDLDAHLHESKTFDDTETHSREDGNSMMNPARILFPLRSPELRLLMTSFFILLVLIFMNDGTLQAFSTSASKAVSAVWIFFFGEI